MTDDRKSPAKTIHPSESFYSTLHATARGVTFDHPVYDQAKAAHPRDGRLHPRNWAGEHPRLSAGPHPKVLK